MPSYPYDAACGKSDLPPETWDAEIAGETERQREARHNAAAAVCVTCPVMDTCHAQKAGGVRAGIVRPDKIPGWTLTESNSWLGWSRDDHELHGNEAGVRRHYRDGSKPCLSCLAWLRRDAKDTYNRAA